MTRLKTDQAQCQVAEAKRARAAKRRLRKDPYLGIRPYCTEILGWAACEGASKSIVQDLLRRCFGITISKDRLYRFVISEIGKWPNGRVEKSPEKKMPSFRSAAAQARYLVRQKTRHGHSRRNLPREERNFITSIGTETKYRGNVKRVIEWLRKRRLQATDFTVELAADFLQEHCEHWTQKTLDGYRQSIALVFGLDVRYIASKKPTVLAPRAYRLDQIALICAIANKPLGLSIRLALHAGLRAHELDTLARQDEMREDFRPWLRDRFAGREGEARYVVQGKGGLRRTVLFSSALAAELEQTRLPAATIKREREINYSKRYAVVGGQAFSQQFSRLSTRVLGWSVGAHGLRHRFAQDRLRALQFQGFLFSSALEILAQELGHFSVTNTLAYLR